MRGTYGLILCLGLAGLLTGTIVSAQDAAKPITIQVVVGPDGTIKILDAKTGKEIAGACVIKVQAQPGQIQIQGQGQPLDKKQLEELHKLLQEGIAQSENKPTVRVIPDGRDAIHHAIKYARKGELVVTLGDKVVDDIRFVHEYRDMVNEKKAE